MDWPQSQTKLFRALLYCYPAEFRHEYGAEMRRWSGRHAPHCGPWIPCSRSKTSGRWASASGQPIPAEAFRPRC
jgi:hypothetical protein